METFVWQKQQDPNYIKSGIRGWRCLGGAPKSRYDYVAKEWINRPPVRSKYGYYLTGSSDSKIQELTALLEDAVMLHDFWKQALEDYAFWYSLGCTDDQLDPSIGGTGWTPDPRCDTQYPSHPNYLYIIWAPEFNVSPAAQELEEHFRQRFAAGVELYSREYKVADHVDNFMGRMRDVALKQWDPNKWWLHGKTETSVGHPVYHVWSSEDIADCLWLLSNEVDIHEKALAAERATPPDERGKLVHGECDEISVFVRKSNGQGSDSWEPAEECFIKTEKTSNLYTPEGRTRYRHLFVSMFPDIKAGLQLGEYFVDIDDFELSTGDPSISIMPLYHGGPSWPLLKIITPASIAQDKSFYTYPGIANESWNLNYEFPIPGSTQSESGNIVRSSYFQDWLQSKYSLMGRTAFDEWAMKLAYGDPSNGKWGGTMLNKGKTANVQVPGWPLHARPNQWAYYIDLVDLGDNSSWTGSWMKDANLFTKTLRDSGLGSFGTGTSVREPATANGKVYSNTFDNYELTWHYQGPGPVSLADEFDGDYLQWPELNLQGTVGGISGWGDIGANSAEGFTRDRGQFWNCLAAMLIPEWYTDTFSTEIEPGVSVPNNGYVLELVDDALAFSDTLGNPTVDNADIRPAGKFIVYRESYMLGAGPLQDLNDKIITRAGMESDLVKRGLGQLPARDDVFNVTPWTDRIPTTASQIDPFFVRWYGTPESIEQTLP
jgi:hypothetical protein